MIRRARAFVVPLIVLLLLLLLVLPGCADSPVAPEAPAAGPGTRRPDAAPRSADLEGMLDDPLVAALLGGLHDREEAARLDLGLRAARIKAEAGEASAARSALGETIGILAHTRTTDDPDDAIALAALELVLLDLVATTGPKGDPR